ncbi:MAG: FkbM family methyltransferase [Bacteroidota bacterium]
MKKLIKKGINIIIDFMFIFVKSNVQRAKIYTFFSKLIYNKVNEIEYDGNLNVFWLKSNPDYLFAVDKPYFNYSKANLYNFLTNVYCKNYTPKKGDVVIDLGAGVGTETLFFYEKIGANGKIHSIEASPNTFIKLNDLCNKNNFTNTSNYNIAISNFVGKIWIEETDKFEVNQVNTSKKGLEINCYTFDQFTLDNNITRIDFLKVNIEGAELEMIDGMVNSIKFIDNVAISCHDFLFSENKNIMTKVVQFLKNNNFEISYNQSGNKVIDSWVYGKRK